MLDDAWFLHLIVLLLMMVHTNVQTDCLLLWFVLITLIVFGTDFVAGLHGCGVNDGS